jgi:broad specificity phosphatase PhoE
MVDLLDFSETVKSLYLVRHGETAATQKGRICGESNISLNDEGFAQANVLGSWFSDMEISSIFSSPLARAVQTADAIAKAIKMPTYFKHSGLTEKKEGEWEGKTYWQLRDEDPKAWEKWSNNPIDFAPPGGESVRSFVDRIDRALKDIINNYETGNRLVLTTHAGVIRGIILNCLNIPTENFFRLDIPTGSITKIEYSENFATLKYTSLTLESYSYVA